MVETLQATSLRNGFEPLGYRIHQWQHGGKGVVGKSNAFGWKKPENHEQGMIWAKHAATEVANWGVFLPQLFELYKVVKNRNYNPFTDLSVIKVNGVLSYVNQ